MTKRSDAIKKALAVCSEENTAGAFAFIRILLIEHDLHSFQENLDIQPEVPVSDVFFVQLYHFLKVGDIASAADLPETCEAGTEAQADLVVELVVFKLIHRGRTGAYQAHIAFEDIPELGQLVDTGVSYKGTYAPDDPGIIVDLEHLALNLILGHQFFFRSSASIYMERNL